MRRLQQYWIPTAAKLRGATELQVSLSLHQQPLPETMWFPSTHFMKLDISSIQRYSVSSRVGPGQATQAGSLINSLHQRKVG